MDDPSENAPELWAALLDDSNQYSLYDVDKDGIPDLFIRYGNWEAEYHWGCYTFRNGKVEKTGDIPVEYASLYTWPEGNSVAVFMSCQGTVSLNRYTLEKGILSGPRQVFYEETVNTGRAENTPIEEILPGTERIPVYRMTNNSFELTEPCPVPILLPIYDYGTLPRQNPAPMEESEVRSAIGRVLWEGAELVGVSGDGYTANVGTATMEEYLEKERIFTGSEEPLKVPRYAWADMNGDGQTDCVLFVGSTDIYGYTGTNYMILSVEDGTVYAYFYSCNLNGFAITSDGTVYFDCGFGEWGRESFYKNQCYRYPVPAPAEWDDLAWEKFN